MDQTDLLILKKIYDQDHDPTYRNRPNFTVKELQEEIGVLSVGAIHNRLAQMRERGLLEKPPSRRIARSLKISREGIRYLQDQLMIS